MVNAQRKPLPALSGQNQFLKKARNPAEAESWVESIARASPLTSYSPTEEMRIRSLAEEENRLLGRKEIFRRQVADAPVRKGHNLRLDR